MPAVRPAGTDYAPIAADNPDLVLWDTTVAKHKKYYSSILAEDIFRCFVLKPKLCQDTPGTRFNMHLIGERAEALLALAREVHPDFHSLIEEQRDLSTQELADSLCQAFADDIRGALPDAPVLGPVFFNVARYVRSTSWYGNTRVLLSFSWSKTSGFAVAPTAPLAHGKEIAALWGERTKVPKTLAKAMKRLANCSGRSLCENGTQLEVLCGPLAFCNCACEPHANIRPHGIFGLLTCGAINTLVAEDFTHAIPHKGRVDVGDELLLFYGADYARKLPCTLCNNVIPPHAWERTHERERRQAMRALKLARKEAKVAAATLRGEAPAPCAPAGSAHLYSAFKSPPSHFRQADAGHALLPERADNSGACNFIVATLNTNAKLAGTQFTHVLGELLFQMKRHSVAVLALQETGLLKPDGLLLDTSGMAERVLVNPGGGLTRFRSLWSFPPGPDAVPQGTGLAIIWDAALPFESPFRSRSGRISAVTLTGPTGAAVRILNVYGKSGAPPADSNSSLTAKYERALRRCLLAEIEEQLEYARARQWTPIVMGDMNELADPALDKQPPTSMTERKRLAAKAPPPRPITDLLGRFGLVDTFRAKHPALRAFSYIGKGKTKARPSRLDYIWCGARLVRTGRYRAGIDGEQRVFGLSDHLLCHAAFTFYCAFRASRATTMVLHEECVRTLYPFHMLEGSEIRTVYREALLGRVAHLIATAEDWASSSSLPDMAECTALWTALEHAIVEESTTALAAHSTTLKTRGLGPFGLVQRVLAACNRASNAIRGALTQTDRSIKGAWRTITSSWTRLMLLVPELPPPLADLPPSPDRNAAWRRATFRALGAIARAVREQWSADLLSSLRACIAHRNDVYEEAATLGRPAAALNKATHDGAATLPIRQAVTPEGGLSTCPRFVREATGRAFYEPTRSRKLPDEGATLPSRVPNDPPISLPPRRDREAWIECFATLRRGRAAGPTGIVAEMLRALPSSIAAIMGWLLDSFMMAGFFPPSFLHGHIYPIPKRGATSAADARPIALLELPLKMLTSRVQHHVRGKLEKHNRFSRLQFGFRKGRGCAQAISQLLSVLEDAKQYRRPLHLVLVDLRKAFDSIEAWSLRQAYARAGLSDDLARFMACLDGTGTAAVITPTGLSSPRKVERGVRQGETLSPTKFILWLNLWLETAELLPGYKLRLGPMISIVAYADDIALVAESAHHLQAILSSLCMFLNAHGVEINPGKSHYVTNATGRAPPLDITIFSGEGVPPAAATLPARSGSFVFVYLGISLNLELNWERCSAPLDRKIVGLISLLMRKRLTFGHTAMVLDTIVRGRLSYYMQASQIPHSVVAAWDAQIGKLMRCKAGLPWSASMHALSVARPAGFGLPLPSALQGEVLACEEVIRLVDPGSCGDAARARWAAFARRLRALRAPSSLMASPCGMSASLSLYVRSRLAPFGLDICEHESLGKRLSPNAANLEAIPLALILPEHRQDIYAGPLRWLSQATETVIKADGTQTRRLRTNTTLLRLGGPTSRAWVHALGDIFPGDTLCQNMTLALRRRHLPWHPHDRQLPPLRAHDIELYVDGSALPCGKSGWAALLLDTEGGATDGQLLPPLLQPGTRGIVGAFHTFGASAAGSGTMEMMALQEAIRLAGTQCTRLTVHTDYARALSVWNRLPRLSTRELVRGADTPIVMRLAVLKTSRKSLGLTTVVNKVAAHGRDHTQAERHTLGNSEADAAAKGAAAAATPDLSTVYLADGPKFTLTADGLPVYSDPRKFAKKHIGSIRAERWRALPTHGLYCRILEGAWAASVRYNGSVRALARPPESVPSSFLIRWRMMCLRTPTQLGRSADRMADVLQRNESGDALCPLCATMRPGAPARGDSQHVLLSCPCLEDTRHYIRQSMGAILRGVGPPGWWHLGHRTIPLAEALSTLHNMKGGAQGCCSVLSSLPDTAAVPHCCDDWSAQSIIANSSMGSQVFYGLLPLSSAKELHAKALVVVCCVIPAGRWWRPAPCGDPTRQPPRTWRERTYDYDIAIVRIGPPPKEMHMTGLPALAAALGDACFLGVHELTWTCERIVIQLAQFDDAAPVIVDNEGLLRGSAARVVLTSPEASILTPWLGLLPTPSPRFAHALREHKCPSRPIAQAVHDAVAAGVHAMWSYYDALSKNALLGDPLTIQRPHDGAVLVQQSFASLLLAARPLVANDTYVAPASLPSAVPAVYESVKTVVSRPGHQLVTFRGGTTWIRLANDAISVWPPGNVPTLAQFCRYCASRGFSNRLATKAYDYATLSLRPGAFKRADGPSPVLPRKVRRLGSPPVAVIPPALSAARKAARNLLQELSDTQQAVSSERRQPEPPIISARPAAGPSLTPLVQPALELSTWPGRKFILPSEADMTALRNCDSGGREAWLSDEVINSAVALMLCNRACDGSFAISSLAAAQCLAPDGDRTRRHWRLWRLFPQAQRIVIPINIDNIHWCIALVEPRNLSLELWDSAPAQHSHDQLLAKLSFWCHFAQMTADAPLAGPWHVASFFPGSLTHPAARQRDEAACGIFVLARAFEFLAGKQHAFQQDNVPSLRVFTAAALEQQCWTLPSIPPAPLPWD